MRGAARLAKEKLLAAALLAALIAAPSAPAQAPVAHALVDELNHAALDPVHAYRVTDLYLRRDAIRLHLQHGTLVFLQPVKGRITGAVFEGAGEALVLPPERVERQQLAKFTESPILAESFGSAYFRFTDNTYAEVLQQIRAGKGRPFHATEIVERWAPLVPALNEAHSLRVVLDYLQSPPAPYFYAGVNGQRLGGFDIVVDARRTEQILVGQLRWESELRYYDVWCSFGRRDSPPASVPGKTTAYSIDATISPELELEARAELRLSMAGPDEQVLVFHLSRLLRVEEVVELPGPAAGPSPLEFLQNVTLTAEEAKYRGSDFVLVVLPRAASPPGRALQRTLRFRYRGPVISELGSGVLDMQARDTWYPVLDQPSLADFQLHFRYPTSLEVVAVGREESRREENGWKESTWMTEVPLPVAGFNVGDYETKSLDDTERLVTVYTHRQLEPSLARVLRPEEQRRARTDSRTREGRSLAPPTSPAAPPPLLVEKVGREVSAALRYYTELFGPVPYASVKVSQIPGRIALGYPGLLYLSTLSFLPEDEQIRLGLNQDAREHFSEITPAHETAHQWWGNWVWMVDQRHQWLSEGLATYSALLFLERQPESHGALRKWLERYRTSLMEEDTSGHSPEAAGSLSLGSRLNSSRSPEGYTRVIYSKGPWVIHMLRELFRDPETGSDQLFLGVLRKLVAEGGDQPLTAEWFQQQLEAALPPRADLEENGRLDWFFQQWVYDTGIPRYHLEWQSRGGEHGGWLVEGLVEQAEVSDLFTMPVPIYARYGEELVRLGTVKVTGEVAAFRFPVPDAPDALVLDPYLSVLAVTE